MAHSVYYVDRGIELNLTLPDLGHPDLPHLWEELRKAKIGPGRLQCLQCRENDPDCPEWMYLQTRAGNRRVAVHHNTSIREHTSSESNTHKALKDRIAAAAEDGGFTAELEARAEHGKRRTDVLVHGSDGFLLGCEAQISYATAAAVRKRSAIARQDGITPLWTTNDRKAQLIDQVPWARIDRMPWHDIANGAELPVRGGIRALRMERCQDRPVVCPDRKRGRCNRWHASWTPRELRLDDLIVNAAGQQYVPVHIPTSRGSGHWFWVTNDDKATYIASVHDAADSTTTHTRPAVPADNRVAPRPLSRSCNYRQESEVRAEPARPRDTGEHIEAPTVTLDHVTKHQHRQSAPLTPSPAGIARVRPLSVGWLQIQLRHDPATCAHVWPPEIHADSSCDLCGLELQDWSLSPAT
ncbi:hypothetical protein ABT369_03370 [Dactylosporangium sp. NPDC000244]|uniref:competence protein CoiA family protein n=1 Tax=Dactylosporangium sp. NPDC000244 TaxID=3154365 RepID=UPI0033306D52